jgi:UDP-glucose:(heptosyl)LPS alpha-1,3-glucosyltransferase
VALISEWLDAWRGGAETSTSQFMHHLISQGVEVHLFTRSRPSPMPGLVVHVIGGASMSRTRRSVTFVHRVRWMLAERHYDVVHAVSAIPGADVYQPRGGTVAETIERNIAVRSTAIGRSVKRCAQRLNLKQQYMLRIEGRLFAPTQNCVVVAISDYVVRQLREHYALADSRIVKIFNGVDGDDADAGQRARDRDALRTEFSVGRDELLVLCVAHNFHLKGIRCWMDALARLLRDPSTPPIRSLIVGKGDSEWWHRRAHRLALGDRLTFVGPSESVAMFRHAADVLVHPTYYDPCSRVVLEGMVSGLPCVTTRWDGASEMIEDGVNGFVLREPDDVTGLCDRVRRLADPRFRAEMGRSAARVAERVSMRRHAKETLALYECLIRERARA